MKEKKEKCELSKKDIDRGFTEGMAEENEKNPFEKMFEPTPGGFLGRPKGWER